jgi:hypothetical protein
VDATQVAIENRYYGLNWVSPYGWDPTVLLGIAPMAPILYEGGLVLNPAGVAGCNAAYPTGGYDC